MPPSPSSPGPSWVGADSLCPVPLQLEIRMQVEYMSFSAHADAKGIMQLVGQAEPESVLLVHGEAKKMEFLKQKIEQEFRRQPMGEGGRTRRVQGCRQGCPMGSAWWGWPA